MRKLKQRRFINLMNNNNNNNKTTKNLPIKRVERDKRDISSTI